MSGTVELPVWVVVLGAGFAVIALIDRVVGPYLRWMLRKRFARAIDRLNARLDLRIQDFKLIKRQVLIDRLAHDPEVMAAIEGHMAETGEPRDVAVEKIGRYAREIVPSFSATAYFAVGARITRWIAQSLYRVRLGAVDEAALERLDREAAVVFVINHRSNADYLLVTYMASTRSALSYAVGEWARIWPLSRIIRAMGAYFIRRRSRNALYRKVLARYVRMATDAGVTQAVFLEGGLSRDGRQAPPKLGLLSYIVNGFDPETRDVVFIPVGLNYDRVLEDRVLTQAHGQEGTPRFPVSIWTTAAFVLRMIRRRLTGRYYRFGYACVSFGEPLSLGRFMASGAGEDTVAALGAELSARIGRVIPVLPVSLVASVLLASERALSMAEIKARAERLLERLRAAGAHSHIPRNSTGYAVEVGMRMLTLRGFVTGTDEAWAAAPAHKDLLRYYANAIAHLLPEETA